MTDSQTGRFIYECQVRGRDCRDAQVLNDFELQVFLMMRREADSWAKGVCYPGPRERGAPKNGSYLHFVLDGGPFQVTFVPGSAKALSSPDQEWSECTWSDHDRVQFSCTIHQSCGFPSLNFTSLFFIKVGLGYQVITCQLTSLKKVEPGNSHVDLSTEEGFRTRCFVEVWVWVSEGVFVCDSFLLCFDKYINRTNKHKHTYETKDYIQHS